jgi:hypothetical protein
MKLELPQQIFGKYSNFMKLRPVGAMLFHVDRNGRKDGHDEANSRLSQFCERAELLG